MRVRDVDVVLDVNAPPVVQSEETPEFIHRAFRAKRFLVWQLVFDFSSGREFCFVHNKGCFYYRR